METTNKEQDEKPKQFTINFFDDRASLLSSQFCQEGALALPPEPPLREETEDYRVVFSHWRPDIRKPITAPLDFVAVYHRLPKTAAPKGPAPSAPPELPPEVPPELPSELPSAAPPRRARRARRGLWIALGLFLALAACLLWLRQSGILAPEGSEEVAEKAFAALLREHDEQGLTGLAFGQGALRSIAAIEAYPQFQELDLSYNAIADPSPLQGLGGLAILSLAYNQIEDISALAQNKRLELLDLSGNPIRDFSPLEELKGLHTLVLDDCKISSLDFVKELPELRWLSLNAPLEALDLHALYGLSKLEQLQVQGAPAALRDQVLGLRKALPNCQVLSDFVFAKSLTLPAQELHLAPGESSALLPQISPQEAQEQADISWLSSDEKVASVSQDGVVTALAAGVCYISVTADGLTQSLQLHARDVGAPTPAPAPQTRPGAKPNGGSGQGSSSSQGSSSQGGGSQPAAPPPPAPPVYQESDLGLDVRP